MQRRTNLQISSAIIISGIITILIQFAVYYFFEAYYVVWGISFIASIICSHIILQQSASYEACYCYSLLTIFISLVITAVVYFGDVQTFLPFSNLMPGIVFINWFAPMLHCFIRYVSDYGTRVEDFYTFYRNVSIIFLIFYLIIIIYASFDPDAFEWAYPIKSSDYNLLPFEKLASLIEDYIYGKVFLDVVLFYLLSRILIYIPYGFYLKLVLYKKSRIMRLISYFLLPLVIELVQYFIIPSLCDIDDIIYAVTGSFLGSLFFLLLNCIVRAISGRDFLISNSNRRSSFHF